MFQKGKYDYSCVYPKHYCELKEKQRLSLGLRGKLLLFLKSMFYISQKNFYSYWHLRSTGAIQQEITRHRNLKHWYIFHPFSQTRLIWEYFMLCVLFFSIVFLPLQSCLLNTLVAKYYLEQNRSVFNIQVAILIDLVLDIIWIMDTFGYFVTGYYDSTSGKVVMDPKKIMKKYARCGFILDVTACIPFEAIIMLIFGIEMLAQINHILFILLQIYHIYSFIRFRHYITRFNKIGNLGNVAHLTLRLVFAFIVYFWIINWSIYLSLIVPQMVYASELFEQSSSEPKSWAQAEGLFDMPLLEQYKTALLKSIFVNLGVSTWDNMFAVDDYVMAVIICVSGRIYWIYFLVWFLEAVTAAQVLRTKFILILEELKGYMKEKEVPLFLKKRLNRFYFYRFQAHYFRDRAILGRLTDSLRKEISMYTCQKLIHNTEVFQSLPRRVVARLVQRMHREMYFPNDVIVRANTFGECMYFICSGTVAVWTATEKEICRLEDGEFFGEIALIVDDRRRTATVTAVTITEVYRLESSDYKRIIKLYPDVYTQLEKFAAVRFKMLVTMEGKSESRGSHSSN